MCTVLSVFFPSAKLVNMRPVDTSMGSSHAARRSTREYVFPGSVTHSSGQNSEQTWFSGAKSARGEMTAMNHKLGIFTRVLDSWYRRAVAATL